MGAPETIEDLKLYTETIIKNIVKAYDKNNNRFIDQFAKDTEGLIYYCAGCISLLLPAIALKIDLGQDEISIINIEVNKIIQHLDNYGFDGTPFVYVKDTERYFSRKSAKYNYIDSVTWVLSCMILIRLAERTGRITIDADKNKIFSIIKEALEIICKSETPLGGWGYTEGCKRPDFYFSYAVSEALADFGDYVLFESKNLNDVVQGEDIELQNYLDGELLLKIRTVRDNMLEWLIKSTIEESDKFDYGKLGGYELLKQPGDDKFGTKFIEYNRLYYNCYVINMLILNWPDKDAKYKSDKYDYFDEKKELVFEDIEQSIYIIRKKLVEALKTGDDWWSTRFDSCLPLAWPSDEGVKKDLLGNVKLYEPGLVPLLSRSNILYTYYIANGPDYKIDKLFQLVHDDCDSDTGLWDAEQFNILVTERAIEAVVDYADYLVRFNPHSDSRATEGRVETINSVVEEEIESYLKKFVLKVVSEYFESTKGRHMFLRNIPITSVENSDMTDQMFLKKIIALEMDAINLLNNDTITLDKKLLETYIAKHGFLNSLIICRAIKSKVDDVQKRKNIDKNYDANKNQLLDIMVNILSEVETSIDMSDIKLLITEHVNKMNKPIKSK